MMIRYIFCDNQKQSKFEYRASQSVGFRSDGHKSSSFKHAKKPFLPLVKTIRNMHICERVLETLLNFILGKGSQIGVQNFEKTVVGWLLQAFLPDQPYQTRTQILQTVLVGDQV